MPVKVFGRLRAPSGDAKELFTDSGTITFQASVPTVVDGAMVSPGVERTTVTNGVVKPVFLAPGACIVHVSPRVGARWAFPLAVNDTPIDLSRVAPVATVDGHALAKGETGASAYQVAVRDGFTGTETEWIESLHARGTGLAVSRHAPGVLALAGTAVLTTGKGVVALTSPHEQINGWAVGLVLSGMATLSEPSMFYVNGVDFTASGRGLVMELDFEFMKSTLLSGGRNAHEVGTWAHPGASIDQSIYDSVIFAVSVPPTAQTHSPSREDTDLTQVEAIIDNLGMLTALLQHGPPNQ